MRWRQKKANEYSLFSATFFTLKMVLLKLIVILNLSYGKFDYKCKTFFLF